MSEKTILKEKLMRLQIVRKPRSPLSLMMGAGLSVVREDVDKGLSLLDSTDLKVKEGVKLIKNDTRLNLNIKDKKGMKVKKDTSLEDLNIALNDPISELDEPASTNQTKTSIPKNFSLNSRVKIRGQK